MKSTLLLSLVVLIAAPAVAGLDIQPISGTDYLSYNAATGQISPITAETRIGPAIWSAGERYINYFWSADPWAGEVSIDWGDILGPAYVGAFGFSEYTNSQDGDGDLFALVIIYTEEDGGNSSGRIWLEGYLIDNIPASTHPPDEFWGYHWKVQPATPFTLNGSDLDGDGLVDWGYLQYFNARTPASTHGPGICGLIWDNDPNAVPPESAPGRGARYRGCIRPVPGSGA